MKIRYLSGYAAIAAATLTGVSKEVKAQSYFIIGSGMQIHSENMQVSMRGGSLVNFGTYTDTTGSLNFIGGVDVSGSGITTLNNLNIDNTGLSRFFSLVSVKNTANIISGNVNANNNLFLRSDLSPLANMVVSGKLTGTVQGLVTAPSVTTGPCPSYSATLSLNVSGPVVSYQWQSSDDNMTWNDIPGANADTYSPMVTADTYFRCKLTTTNSSYEDYTPGVLLEITGIPDAVTVSGSGAHCGEATILASGGSGGTIYYQGTTAAGTSTVQALDTATIDASGTYYFRSRSVAGCWGPEGSADVVINPILATSVDVTSAPGMHVCKGTRVSFTATPENGGTTPGYVWYVNSSAMSTSGPDFSYIPANGDVVKVTMTSSIPCPASPTTDATTNMTVDDPFIPVVNISADPSTSINKGETVTLTAQVSDAGPSPKFQWMKNGIAVNGETSATYTSNSFENGDVVSCEVIGSGICALSTFNSVMMNVNSASIKNLIAGANIGIMPNPNNGKFTIRGTFDMSNLNQVTAEITNMLGQTVYQKNVQVIAGKIDTEIELGNVARGTYILSLSANGEKATFHVVVGN